jgi:thiamine-phosphate pyrophosphorylase
VSLTDAALYLVSPARIATGLLADAIPDLVAAGVDVIQLREKELTTDDLSAAAEPIVAACRAAGVPFILNDYPELAASLGADGVHVGQEDTSVDDARRAVGDGLVGLSTHSRDEIDGSRSLRPDYIAVGPVFATPTKPGRPAVGLELIRYAATHAPDPWFAIGGIDSENLAAVLDAGARRIVVVRAITESRDPPSAARALKARLPPR